MRSYHSIINTCCAGGGKTTQIIKYIKNLLDHGVCMSRILIISFSNATINVLVKRLAEYNVQVNNITTLHAFCHRFQSQSITTDIEIVITQMIKNYSSLKSIPLSIVRNILSVYYQSNVEHSTYIATMLNENNKNIFLEIVKLSKELDLYCDVHKIIPLWKICHSFYQNIEDNTYDIYSKFDYLLIDEAQDLSWIQLRIIAYFIKHIFIHDNKKFTVVGDEHQCIYNFQGSLVSYYTEFISYILNICIIQKHKVIQINNTKTYRFGGELLSKINTLFYTHTSDVINTTYSEKTLQNPMTYISNIINKYAATHTIGILFQYHDHLTTSLQNHIKKGVNIKIKIRKLPIFKYMQMYYQSLTKYNGRVNGNIPDHTDIFQMIYWCINRCTSKSYITNQVYEYLINRCNSYHTLTAYFLTLPDVIYIKSVHKTIKFLTIHSSKGSEFDIVIHIKQKPISSQINILTKYFMVWYGTENLLQSLYKQEILTLNRNLIYVAMTRAKKKYFSVSI